MITVTLSKDEMDTSAVGYQPPLPADQVKPSNDYDYEGEGSPIPRGRGRGSRGRGRGRGRGQGRGPPGNGFMPPEYEDGGWDQNGGYPRGRGLGDEVVVVVSAAVGEEVMATVVPWMMTSNLLEATIKAIWVKGVVVVAVVGVVVEGVVVVDARNTICS